MRRNYKISKNQWAGKTDGTEWMQSILKGILRFIPHEVLYGIMALIVPFYMVFNNNAYLSIYHYFRCRLGFGRVKSFVNVYRNHFVFGQVVLDRFAAFAGMRFRLTIDHIELFEELASRESAFLMLSSHMGCFEMAGCMLTSKEKVFNVLVYMNETETINKSRNRLMSTHNMRMIPLKEDMSHLFAINAALDKGEIVSMSADRINGSQKTVKCLFMGGDVFLPNGPFVLSQVKKIPMLAVFVMKDGIRHYRVFISKIENAQQFASHMEDVLRKYPTQWFNYYDYWKVR